MVLSVFLCQLVETAPVAAATLLALVFANVAQGATADFQRAQARPPSVAPEPATLETTPLLREQGILEEGDSALPSDGSLYDIYPLQGTANQQLTIAVESKQFDTVLAVVDEEYNVIEQNDDIDKSTKNSALTVTLPKDGTYYVIVNAYDNSGRGQYSLTIR